MKNILYYFCFFLISCHQQGKKPDIIIPTSHNVEKSELIGIWKIDSFSKKMIQKKSQLTTSGIILKINADSSFDIIGVPDFIFNLKGNQFLTIKGKWNIQKVGNVKKIALQIDPDVTFKTGYNTFFDFYEKNKKLVLWYYIGDPDSGNRLLFERY